MRARTLVYFDGHCLSDYCHISNLVRPVPGFDVTTYAVRGRDGEAVVGQRLLPVTISMQLNFLQEDAEDRRAAMQLVEGWLHAKGERELSFSDQEGVYMAVASRRGDPKRHLTARSETDVAFYCPDPVRRGDACTAYAATGTNGVGILVGGTWPTQLKVSSTAGKRGSTGNFAARLDSSALYIGTALADTSAHAVVFDSESATCKVDGALKPMGIGFDWFDSVEPGEHSVAITQGSGPLTVEWVERWV